MSLRQNADDLDFDDSFEPSVDYIPSSGSATDDDDDLAIYLENGGAEIDALVNDDAMPQGREQHSGCVEVALSEDSDPMTYCFRFAADELPPEDFVRRAYLRHLHLVMGYAEVTSASITVERISFVQPDLFESIEPSLEDALGIDPLPRRRLEAVVTEDEEEPRRRAFAP